MKPAPAWLVAMQARVGAALQTPLDRRTGTLCAEVTAYDPGLLRDLCDGPRAPAGERFAVYHRQYWFRLFTVMHTAFPLTTRLVGPWQFNDHAARFLVAHPPRTWDLDGVPDGFEDFLPTVLAGSDGADGVAGPEATLEAARLDAAWRGLSRAPAVAPFAPRPEDAARLLDTRLDASPAATVFVEHWPLVALKRALPTLPGESPLPVPARCAQPQAWALVREPDGIRQVALEPREGELFRLLREHTVRDALAWLEAACTADARATLPQDTQRWLARGVQLGLWRAPDRGGASTASRR